MNRACGEAGAAIKLSLRSQTGEDGVRARRDDDGTGCAVVLSVLGQSTAGEQSCTRFCTWTRLVIFDGQGQVAFGLQRASNHDGRRRAERLKRMCAPRGLGRQHHRKD